jgi:hypothetical protein
VYITLELYMTALSAMSWRAFFRSSDGYSRCVGDGTSLGVLFVAATIVSCLDLAVWLP